MIRVENVSYSYGYTDEEGNRLESVALQDVSFHIKKGEFVGVLGSNGSGKSTLSRLLNALIFPNEGRVLVNGMDTRESESWFDIRSTCGLVFQNPDNQIIASTVWEDVAEGPQNLGVPRDEMIVRIKDSLKKVSMEKYSEGEYRDTSPLFLSGGQKQRLAIAGVLAMNPECIIFDEPTSMLDPKGRKEVLSTIRELNHKYNITIIYITHFPEEVLDADKILVFNKGNLISEGEPKDIFSDEEMLKNCGLRQPFEYELRGFLRKEKVDFYEPCC